MVKKVKLKDMPKNLAYAIRQLRTKKRSRRNRARDPKYKKVVWLTDFMNQKEEVKLDA